MDATELIRAARDAYNRAIAARDPDGIAACLADHYVLITSRDEMLHGRDAVHRNWIRKFERDPDVCYTRTPESVEVDEAARTATEFGRWDGHHSADGQRTNGAGIYVARWQREADGAWRLRAEHFTPD